MTTPAPEPFGPSSLNSGALGSGGAGGLSLGVSLPRFEPPATAFDPNAGPTFGQADIDPESGRPYPRVGIGRTSTGRWWERRPTAGGRLGREMAGAPDVDRPPVYRPEEQFETASAPDVQNDLFDMPKAELRALQRKMYDAGFYGNAPFEQIVLGVVDDATWNAFGDLLDMNISYVEAGREVAWFETLDEVQQLRRQQGTNLLGPDGQPKGPERDPFVARTTAPQDIETMAQHVATQLLGQEVDPGLVRQIIANFQGAEVSAQRAMYDAQPGGGTVVDNPSLETFATQAIEQADPIGTTAYAGADRVMNDFLAVLQGPFGG